MKASESEDEESVTGPRAVFCAYEREDDECHTKCKENSHSLSILLRCSYLSPSPRERALKFSAADQQFASISFKNRSITDFERPCFFWAGTCVHPITFLFIV